MAPRQKWRRRIGRILLIAYVNFSLQGCAALKSQTPGSAALYCGAGGALAGAAAGAAIYRKNPLMGAVIGGLAGAVLGAGTCYFIVSYQNREIRDYKTTEALSNYKPTQGNVLKLTDLSVNPAVAIPGTKMGVNASYYVMTPNQNQDIPITETWSVLKQENSSSGQYKEIGSQSKSITVKPGTRQSAIEFPLQRDAREGSYVLALKIAQGNLSDQKDANFTITRDLTVAQSSGSKSATSNVMGRSFVVSNTVRRASVRAGPSRNDKVVGTVGRGERYPVLDTQKAGIRGDSRTWYKLRLDDGTEAWIDGTLGALEE